MERYAEVLLIAIPGFLVLIGIELLYGHLKGKQTYSLYDTISSLSSGLTNIIKDIMGLAIVLVSYSFLKNHIQLFSIESTIWTYIIAFIAIDFAGYWQHRISHSINYFWNEHVIHHSSEEFNLACALRQPVSTVFQYFSVLLIPAAICGIDEILIATIVPIHLFMQFWYHTRHIGKLGWVEYILVTPSQHRVHHAINAPYIDKNLGQIFCIWDRIFGTFQEELEEEPAVYGILKPASTWNPYIINFQHFMRILKDAWYTKNYWDKIRIWFMPTGWRPKDVQQKFPIKIVENVHQQTKYKTIWDKTAMLYIVVQYLVIVYISVLYLLYFSDLMENKLKWTIYGIYILLSIFSLTAFMDGKKGSKTLEYLRILFGMFLMYFYTHFFPETIIIIAVSVLLISLLWLFKIHISKSLLQKIEFNLG